MLGVTGSGKSTLAAELARRMGAPHIELDGFLWEPNWPRAETFIWLDYPLPIIYLRLLRRTLWRAFARVELWNGDCARLWPHVGRRDSLFVWAFTSQLRHRRDIR